MMQQTSIQAYLQNIETLNLRQRTVLKAISTRNAICNQQLAEILKWPINSITPRVLELRSKGCVEEAFKDKYPATNRTVIYWRQVPKYETSLEQYGDE